MEWQLCWATWLILIVWLGSGQGIAADEPARGGGHDAEVLPLEQFRPRSMLQVPRTRRTRAKFPVVDVHTHFRHKLQGGAQGVADYVRQMDRSQIAVSISLDGGLGDAWQDHESLLWRQYRDRFVIFVSVDWLGSGTRDDPASWDCNRPDFAHRMVEDLHQAQARGASGLKVFKALGLEVPNPDGTLARIDDPRWDPIWRACGDLNMPILIHAADPLAFWQPVDAHNERWEELRRHPDWSFHDSRFPRHAELLGQFLNVVGRHPRTNFIAGHMANLPEDLATLGKWLDAHSNLYVETASRIAELGRQPFTARAFFIKYSDRILFGTDGPWPEQRLHYYWRFLETRDEYFPYSEKPFPPQGFWRIYGLGLPDDVLKKVYYANATRLIPGVESRWQKYADILETATSKAARQSTDEP